MLNSKAILGCVLLQTAFLSFGCGNQATVAARDPGQNNRVVGNPQPAQASNGQNQGSDQQAVGQNNSQGSGGKTGDFETSYTSSNGLSSKFHINVPSDSGPTKAYGLLVYLHGDGGKDYSWFYDSNQQIAAQNNLIGMTVLSPNNGEAWYDNGSAQALFLDDLLQKEILAKYNIDRKRIYFAGASGGSQFLTGLFVPVYGSHYQGGSVQMCGGGTNWTEQFNSTPDFLKGFKLFFYTQTSDFLYSQVVEAIDYYSKQGMTVKKELPSGGSHCGFALDEVLPKALAEIMK